MTFIGKIFTTLIFVSCLVFLGMTLAVYSTHQNWREFIYLDPNQARQQGKEMGLYHQLLDERERVAQAMREKQDLEDKLNTERIAKRIVLASLETERLRQQQEIDALKSQYQQAIDTLAKNTASLTESHQQLASYNREVQGLRIEIRQTQQDRDDRFLAIVRQTDANHQLLLERRRLEDRQRSLTELTAQQKRVLDAFGLEVTMPLDGIAPRVSGLVTAVRQSGEDTLVAVSVGSDDGILVGHIMDIYRGEGFIGRIRISRTEPNRAVGVSDPQFLKRPIQTRDEVVTLRPALPSERQYGLR